MKNKQIMAIFTALAMLCTGCFVFAGTVQSDADAADSFQALSEAIAGDEPLVVLGADIDATAQLVVTRTMTLDLNGHRLYNTTDIWDSEPGAWSLISVQEEGDLTVIDSSADSTGKVDALENDCYAFDVRDVSAKLSIYGGQVLGNVHAVYVFEGELIVYGGEFSVKQKFSQERPDEYVLNCYDANYRDGIATVAVYGGTFVKFNPSDCYAENEHTNFMAAGYTATADGENFVASYAIPIIMVNGTATNYPSIMTAIYGCEAGSTITVTGDIVEPSVIISKDLIVDLGEKTADVDTIVIKDSTVTLKNGIINGNVEVLGSSVVALDSDLIIDTEDNAVVLSGTGTFGTEGCKTPVLNVKGTVNSVDTSILTMDEDLSKPVINVSAGADVMSTEGVAILIGSGDLNITGGKVEGPSAIYFNGNSMNLSAGTFKATGQKLTVGLDSNIGMPTGDAIVIQNMGYAEGETFTITLSPQIVAASVNSTGIAYFEGEGFVRGTVNIPLGSHIRGASAMVDDHLLVDMTDAFEVNENMEFSFPYNAPIILLDDLVLDEELRAPAVTFTMNLNGHSIISEADASISIMQFSKVTIVGDSNARVAVPVIIGMGELTINGGTYVSTITLNNTGKLIVKNGVFNAPINQSNGTMAIENGTFSANITSIDGQFTLKGGLFDGSVVSKTGNASYTSIANPVTMRNGATITFVALKIVSNGVTTTRDGMTFEGQNMVLSGKMASSQVMNVKSNSTVGALELATGARLNVPAGVILTVDESLVSALTGTGIDLDGQISVAGNATITGKVSVGGSPVTMNALKGYGDGYLIKKGSVILGGDFASGTASIFGDIKFDGNIDLKNATMTIESGSTLTIKDGSSLTGGQIVNNGTIKVYGTLNSDVQNNSHVVNVGGNVSGVKGKAVETPFVEIVPFKVPDATVGSTLIIPVSTTPAKDVVLAIKENSTWLDVKDGCIIGSPETAGNYTFTLTASIFAENQWHTEEYQFSIHVDNVPHAEKKGIEIGWSTIIIAFFVIFFAIIVVAAIFR